MYQPTEISTTSCNFTISIISNKGIMYRYLLQVPTIVLFKNLHNQVSQTTVSIPR
jgi:hypothetical protein